jgi:MFS family permease
MTTEAGPKRELPVLYAAVLASRIGFGVIIIIFPSYIKGVSDIVAALTLAAYPIFEAGAAIPMGRFCDTGGRKRIFVVSLGFMAIMMASIGLTNDIYAVATVHALMGIGAAGVTVSTLTMITDLTRVTNRGTGMGAFDFVNVGGYAIGLLLGTIMDSAFKTNLSLAFFSTGAIVASAFLIGWIVVVEPSHQRSSTSWMTGLNPLRSMDVRAKVILPIWLGVTILLGMVFFLPRAFERVGLGGGTTGGILLAGVLILGLGSIGFGALSDIVGRLKVLLTGVAGMMGLLISLAFTFGSGVGGLYRNLPVIAVFALASSALVPTILATVGDRALLERRGTAMGLYSVMLSGGTAVGTLLAGTVHHVSGLTGILETGSMVFALACLSSLILWLLLARRIHNKPM